MKQGKRMIRISADLHQLIAVQAAKEGIYHYELVDKTIRKYIDDRNRPRLPKRQAWQVKQQNIKED